VQETVDLVMVIVPPKFVLPAVTESVSVGAKGIIIITAGLGEGEEDRKRIEAEILTVAAKTGTYIIGPNCSGLFNASAHLNLLGLPDLASGPISVIAQSGNVIDSLTYYARTRELGFSKIISLGNAIGANVVDYLGYLKDDPETQVIVAYLEGIKDGNHLLRSAREITRTKPIIALKVGRSAAGARAAASHTGSLAGDDLIVNAAFRQAGIVRVSHIDELFDMAEVFCHCPLPAGARVAILSEGGGDNSIAADNAELEGQQVPVLSHETQAKIKPFLLEGMPASNPIDYGGTAEENPQVIADCVRVCMESDEIDAVYLTGFFGGFKDIIAAHVAQLEEKTSRVLVDLVQRFKKPLFVHTSFARGPIESLDMLKRSGIPVMESSQRAMRCLAALTEMATFRKKLMQTDFPQPGGENHLKVMEVCARARLGHRSNLLETESREILALYGMKLLEATLASNVEEAVRVSRELSCPLAVKVVCPDIVHKSDAGGIKLNVMGEAEIRQAFEEILAAARRLTRPERVLGVLLSPMAQPGQECVLGMFRDPQFGPVIMFGLGGVFVEVLQDVSFRVAPLTELDIVEMIQEIKGYPVLSGIRGGKTKDTKAIRSILEILSTLAVECPEIREIDLNPVIIHETGASIVDCRMILED
jgi:acetyltransferase